MKMTVYFEPDRIFTERVKDFTDVLYLGEFIKSNDSKEKTIVLKESYDILVISSNDLSGVNHHVMEGINKFINIMKSQYGLKNVFINNPTKTLLRTLRNTFDIEEKEPYTFPSITEEKIIRVEKEFNKFIIGQYSAKRKIIRTLLRLLIRTSNKPLVIMLYGNPGIGKTETAKFLAKQLYDDDFIREQMSMVHGEDSLKYFKSTHHTEDSFSKKLFNRTSNVILLDEFARSPHYIQDSFLQMFDEGVYEDRNYVVDVKESIIICTSNYTTREDMDKNIDNALLSRFDALIKYEDFCDAEKMIIVEKSINQFKNTIIPKYVSMVDWKEVQRFINKNLHGLTNMRHIKTIIEDVVADKILKEIGNISDK